eukprot:scaffold39564_cov54-Phaeocystis_antarctica.AAC.1
MATARLTTTRNLRVAEIYTDMRGEGVKKRVRAARNNRSRAALPDKCRSTCGSELTRRGGDHGQRQKRDWGLGERSSNRPQAAQEASPPPRREHV